MGFILTGRSTKRPKVNISPSKKRTKLKPLVNSKTNIHSILERFPIEIMFQIFVYTGFESNNLPLTNKYFNKLFKLKSFDKEQGNHIPGIGLITEITRQHYLFDLNEYIDIKYCVHLIEKYKRKANDEILDEIQHCLNRFQVEDRAISSEVFNRKFMNLGVAKVMVENFPNVLEPNHVKTLKNKRLLYVLQEFSRYARKYCQENQMLAKEVESDLKLTREHLNSNINEQETFLDQKVDFPERFYVGSFDQEKLELIQFLSNNLNMKFFNLDRVVTSCIMDEGTLSMVKILEELSVPQIYHSALPVIESFKQRIINKDMIQHLLGKIDAKDGQDSRLWEYLAQTKNTEYLAIVMEVLNPPHYVLNILHN